MVDWSIGKSVIETGYAYARSDFDFEHSNGSFYENELDGIDLSSSNGLDYRVQKNGEKFLWFSADRIINVSYDLSPQRLVAETTQM